METTRLWITAAEGTWVVRAGDAVIGESNNALELQEGDGPIVVYFPRDDIGMAFLERSETQSSDAQKGPATHFHIAAKSGLIRDAGWSYETPGPLAARLAGLIAFHETKVTLEQV